mmetsp:Transcript_45288/g.107621  ORF Transcript_45288/g.107621 Transcript_45288/m.107621 type:complete len:228 (-) Transcript_45288:235-918(-)
MLGETLQLLAEGRPVDKERLRVLGLLLDILNNLLNGLLLEGFLPPGPKFSRQARDRLPRLALARDVSGLREVDARLLEVSFHPREVVEHGLHGVRRIRQHVVRFWPIIRGAVVESVVGVIKALILRAELGSIAQVPLAPHGSVVARARQHLGHRHLVWAEALLLAGPKHRGEARAHRVPARHDGGAAGRAGGLRVGGPEAHALEGHVVQARRRGAPVLAPPLPAQLP